MTQGRQFKKGDQVVLRVDRADAYGLPRGAMYTVVRTYPHKRYSRTWVVIDAPRNSDGTEAVVDSRELRPFDFRSPRLANPSVPAEGPAEHIRNALQIMTLAQEVRGYHQDACFEREDFIAIKARLEKALALLEHERVYTGLPRSPNGRSVRRRNPALAVLGNPRVTDATIATWAKIEYMRPDDPDGSDVVRVHEFKDGFEIGWLSDGTVQLSHPKHPLWMDDDEEAR